MPISFSWLVLIVAIVLLGALLGVVLFARESPLKPAVDAESDSVEVDPEADYTLEDRDLLDVVIRSNESVVANIDALNAAAVGIIALPAAFAVLAIDKIRELAPELAAFSLILLALSVVGGVISYEFGYFFWNSRSDQERDDDVPPRIQDSINPRHFVTLYTLRGSDAVYEQVDQTINISARNASLREWKRRWARASLLLFLVAAIVVAVGRGLAPRETPAKPCSVAISTPVKAKIVVTCP